jgi:Sugar-transfer associated ATP-grasp
MNMVLTPADGPLQGLATDKLLTDMVLTRAGIDVAPIRAVVVAAEAIAPYPVLTDAAAVRRFLLETQMPVFGKPTHGARSVGAVSIVDRQGETLVLGDGRTVGAEALADEILRSFPKGYLFQDLMQPHPELAQLIGPVIGSVRVVTLRIGAEVVPIYAAMKMPGPGQMVDDIASYINTMCSVDYRTGRVVRGQDARRLGGAVLERNPVSGAILAGAVLPLWPEVMQQARDVHRILHRQGVVGADYVITPAGPRVTEVNANPMHAFYQKCFARGFWNADIAPQMTEALAGFGHRAPTKAIPFP